MSTLRTRATLGAAVLAIAAACGSAGAPTTPVPGGSSPAQAPATAAGAPHATPGAATEAIDSCALLTDAELEAATGTPVVSRERSTLTQVFPSVCDIELEGGSLTVSIISSGGRQMYETSFEPTMGDGDFSPIDRPVEGFGDKAAMGGEDTIMVLKDDVLFDVFFISIGRPDKEQVIRYLAGVILAKLPCIATGCAGFTPPPAPSAPPLADVCSLLTTAEIEAETGAKATQGSPTTSMQGDPTCLWTLDSGVLDHVELSLMSTGGVDEFNFYANDYFETPPAHVANLGDDAIKSGTIPAGTYWVVSADQLLTFKFALPISVDDPYATVLPLVELAVSRM